MQIRNNVVRGAAAFGLIVLIVLLVKATGWMVVVWGTEASFVGQLGIAIAIAALFLLVWKN